MVELKGKLIIFHSLDHNKNINTVSFRLRAITTITAMDLELKACWQPSSSFSDSNFDLIDTKSLVKVDEVVVLLKSKIFKINCYETLCCIISILTFIGSMVLSIPFALAEASNFRILSSLTISMLKIRCAKSLSNLSWIEGLL